jgi:hypothetical protein
MASSELLVLPGGNSHLPYEEYSEGEAQSGGENGSEGTANEVVCQRNRHHENCENKRVLHCPFSGLDVSAHSCDGILFPLLKGHEQPANSNKRRTVPKHGADSGRSTVEVHYRREKGRNMSNQPAVRVCDRIPQNVCRDPDYQGQNGNPYRAEGTPAERKQRLPGSCGHSNDQGRTDGIKGRENK